MGGKEGRKKASFYKTSTRVKGGGGVGIMSKMINLVKYLMSSKYIPFLSN